PAVGATFWTSGLLGKVCGDLPAVFPWALKRGKADDSSKHCVAHEEAVWQMTRGRPGRPRRRSLDFGLTLVNRRCDVLHHAGSPTPRLDSDPFAERTPSSAPSLPSARPVRA